MSKCDTCARKQYGYLCDGCIHDPDNKDLYEPMTNADRIRASIEDNKKLAELTIKRKSVFSRTKGYTEILYVCSDGSVTDDWSIAFNREMDWLHQPAEEDDHA